VRHGSEWLVVLVVSLGGLLVAALVALTPWSATGLTGGSTTAGSVEDVVVGVHPPSDEPVVPVAAGASVPPGCADAPET